MEHIQKRQAGFNYHTNMCLTLGQTHIYLRKIPFMEYKISYKAHNKNVLTVELSPALYLEITVLFEHESLWGRLTKMYSAVRLIRKEIKIILNYLNKKNYNYLNI